MQALRMRCIFPQALKPWQKAACVGAGLGSFGVTAYGIYTYADKIGEGLDKLRARAPSFDWTKWLGDDDEEPKKQSKDEKRWYQNKFWATCIGGVTYGGVVLTNTLFGDDAIPSPISLVGDLCTTGIGGFMTIGGLALARWHYLWMKSTLMTTECCVIARAGFATPFLIGPSCLILFIAGNTIWFGINRGMKTVKHICDGTAKWDAVLPDETFSDLVELIMK